VTNTIIAAPLDVTELYQWLRDELRGDKAVDQLLGDVDAANRSLSLLNLLDLCMLPVRFGTPDDPEVHRAQEILIVIAQGYRDRDGFRPDWFQTLTPSAKRKADRA
jgi:hypothetical protein